MKYLHSWFWRQSVRGNNWVLYNYIPAERQFKCYESVTFTTMCDHTFLGKLMRLWTVNDDPSWFMNFIDCIVPVVTRWQGPVSVAIFTPGDDYQTAIETIAFYRLIYQNIWSIDQVTITFLQELYWGILPYSPACYLQPHLSHWPHANIQHSQWGWCIQLQGKLYDGSTTWEWSNL